MPGQAIVTIKDKQWTVSMANTYTELISGLSGVASIPAGTGVLFDLGSDRSYIEIDMTQMLFPLDIVFINSTQGVVGVMHNVQPGATDVRFQNDTLPGARCFLEINAGEAEGIEVGDNVNIQGYTQPVQFNIDTLISYMFIGLVLFMMGRFLFKMLKSPDKTPLLEEKKKPPSKEMSIEEKGRYLEETGRKIAEQADVKFVELEKGWQPKYATARYWFEDSKGNRIIATDLNELEWKLSVGEAKHSHHSNSGEIAKFKEEKVKVLKYVGDRVSIWVPSRQEEALVKPESLGKVIHGPEIETMKSREYSEVNLSELKSFVSKETGVDVSDVSVVTAPASEPKFIAMRVANKIMTNPKYFPEKPSQAKRVLTHDIAEIAYSRRGALEPHDMAIDFTQSHEKELGLASADEVYNELKRKGYYAS